MSSRIAIRFLALFSIIFFVAACAKSKKQSDSEFSQDIQFQLEKVVKDNLAEFGEREPVPGALVGVWMQGGKKWVKGIGLADIETGRVPNEGDKVRIGSNTKTFVASTILQLVDEQRLSLDDTIDKFDLGLEIPNADKITVKMLANMTSGLAEVYEVPEMKEYLSNPLTKADPRKFVEIAVKKKPDFEPGKGWHYSNTGYLILGLIIKKITGHSVAQEVKSRFINDLKLDNTTYPADYPGMPCPYMHGYVWDGVEWEDASVAYNPSALGAAGAMISDINDMQKWVRAYSTGIINSADAQKARIE